MKKIITIIALMALSTVSAKAIDLPDLGFFSLTAGVGSNTSVWGASGKEQNFDNANATIVETNSAEGVFTESYSSQMIELGLGKYVSIGRETMDDLTTPTNIANEGRDAEISVAVKFKDVESTYIKLNIPGGLFLKFADMTTKLDIVESRGDYGTPSLDGSSIGAGYERLFGDSGFGMRLEGTYHEFDNVKVTDDEVNATGNGKNVVTATNIEGLSAKVALTYTLGRNY